MLLLKSLIIFPWITRGITTIKLNYGWWWGNCAKEEIPFKVLPKVNRKVGSLIEMVKHHTFCGYLFWFSTFMVQILDKSTLSFVILGAIKKRYQWNLKDSSSATPFQNRLHYTVKKLSKTTYSYVMSNGTGEVTLLMKLNHQRSSNLFNYWPLINPLPGMCNNNNNNMCIYWPLWRIHTHTSLKDPSRVDSRWWRNNIFFC